MIDNNFHRGSTSPDREPTSPERSAQLDAAIGRVPMGEVAHGIDLTRLDSEQGATLELPAPSSYLDLTANRDQPDLPAQRLGIVYDIDTDKYWTGVLAGEKAGLGMHAEPTILDAERLGLLAIDENFIQLGDN